MSKLNKIREEKEGEIVGREWLRELVFVIGTGAEHRRKEVVVSGH